MDERLIIETQSEVESAQKQNEVHAARVAKYRDEGYVIFAENDVEFIRPKNAATGQTDYSAQPTKLWAEPALTPDNTFSIPAPTDVQPVYEGVDFNIRPTPPEWLNRE